MLCMICGDEHWTALTELNKCYKELKVFVLRDIGFFSTHYSRWITEPHRWMDVVVFIVCEIRI